MYDEEGDGVCVGVWFGEMKICLWFIWEMMGICDGVVCGHAEVDARVMVIGWWWCSLRAKYGDEAKIMGLSMNDWWGWWYVVMGDDQGDAMWEENERFSINDG